MRELQAMEKEIRKAARNGINTLTGGKCRKSIVEGVAALLSTVVMYELNGEFKKELRFDDALTVRRRRNKNRHNSNKSGRKYLKNTNK